MAPIPLKRVVSVSSEDHMNPSSNLVTRGSGRKWLTSPEEKRRRAEVILELSKKARINSVEIGNFGSAFIEIHVCSSAEGSSEWLTLLPSCMLMTVHDSRGGRNKTLTLTCAKERFSSTTSNKKWSHIKVICRQPYDTTAQFGLKYVAFYSEHSNLCSPLTPHCTTSPHYNHPSPNHPSPTPPENTPHHTNRHKLPSLPSVTPRTPGDSNYKPPHLKSSKTPKRPLSEANIEGEYEVFSGVEKQSRLLSNALRAPRGTAQQNPILERIASEREQVKKEQSFESAYQKKRLLVRELTKAEGKTDFVAGFEKASGSSIEMSAAFRKISRHDNGCEIGQEPECQPWGSRGRGHRGRRGKRERGEVGEDGWVRKRRRKLSGMINECRRVLSEAGTAGGTSGQAEDLTTSADNDDTVPIKPDQSIATSAECGSDSDSDATIIMDYPEDKQLLSTSPLQPLSTSLFPSPPLLPSPPLKGDPRPETSVQCPLCGQSFPSYAIELHAASCGDTWTDVTASEPIYID